MLTHSSAKYVNAPISEVIFGVTFNQAVYGNLLFELIARFKKDYPKIQLQSPLPDETLKGYTIENIIEAELTGAFLTRLFSVDDHWLLQLQNNKFFFNWLRRDDLPTGKYPGYMEICRRFDELFNESLESIVFDKNNLNTAVKHYSLIYQDRIFWQDHIKNLSDIGEIIKIELPSLPRTMASSSTPTNIFFKSTIPVEEIGGHVNININTGISSNRPVLILQSEIYGKKDSGSMLEWFDVSRNIQQNLFENIFQQEILRQWQ